MSASFKPDLIVLPACTPQMRSSGSSFDGFVDKCTRPLAAFQEAPSIQAAAVRFTEQLGCTRLPPGRWRLVR